MWVGQQVSHDFISQVFGAPSSSQINTDMVCHCFSHLVVYTPLLPSPSFSFTHMYMYMYIHLYLPPTLPPSLSLHTFLSLPLSLPPPLPPSLPPPSLPPSLPLSLQASLPALDNPLSFRVRAICSQLQETRPLQMKVLHSTHSSTPSWEL